MKTALALLLVLATPLAHSADPAPAAETISLYAKVIVLHQTGIIAQPVDFRDWSSNDVPLPKRDQPILITGHPKQDQLADGDVISVTITPAGTTKYDGATIRTYRYLGEFK